MTIVIQFQYITYNSQTATEYIIPCFVIYCKKKQKITPIHPPPSLSLRKQGSLEEGEFLADVLKSEKSLKLNNDKLRERPRDFMLTWGSR